MRLWILLKCTQQEWKNHLKRRKAKFKVSRKTKSDIIRWIREETWMNGVLWSNDRLRHLIEISRFKRHKKNKTSRITIKNLAMRSNSSENNEVWRQHTKLVSGTKCCKQWITIKFKIATKKRVTGCNRNCWAKMPEVRSFREILSLLN